jgi:hypothetical protein
MADPLQEALRRVEAYLEQVVGSWLEYAKLDAALADVRLVLDALKAQQSQRTNHGRRPK